MDEADRYPTESILVHEFAHAVMNIGMTEEQREAVREAYEKAREDGLYKSDIYMMANADEYWAEGSQSWFDATIRTGDFALRFCPPLCRRTHARTHPFHLLSHLGCCVMGTLHSGSRETK